MADAIMAGDLARVRELVSGDPGALDRVMVTHGGGTLLLWALHPACRKEAVAMFLIEAGADIDAVDYGGWTALMYACRYDQPETAQLLINKGATLDGANKDGWTALMLACRYGQPEVAQLLINKGVKLDLLNQHGWTVLMIACSFDQPETAQLLINKGAKLDTINQVGWTALMYACRHDQPEAAQLLINKGAKLDLANQAGWTVLMIACRYDQPETAQLLINKGAKLDMVQNHGFTALMVACQKPSESHHTSAGLLRCVKLLVAAGAALNLQTTLIDVDEKTGVTTPAGSTAMDIARLSQRSDAVEFLEFVQHSEVSKLLLDTAKASPEAVVRFFDNDVRHFEDCELLDDADLANLGVDKFMVRKRFLAHFEDKSKQRLSLAKRFSKRLSGILGRGNAESHDAFLTHDWGTDELGRNNHARVTKVNDFLIARGKATWFDEDRLEANIAQQIAKGLEASRKVVVFITERYMDKLQSLSEDYCREEFLAACNISGTRNMIAVVMEPRMLDQRAWRGPLQLKMGTHLFLDFSTDEAMDANLPELLNRL
ncbi:Putative ankyrin repeat protein L93 [Durusdinium trenchii]|uniref:Ankyrin repeat protein L93 n=1 Tax=Durusdinium trenchii TaxID=1381693 RepID=A0ABP0QCU9_9DINO